MSKGISLHIGLNSVDPKHYAGWSGPLNACEADAEDMSAIAEDSGFEGTQLLTANATRNAVISTIEDAAKTLQAGDIFLISYSGHGGQVPDMNGDEIDGQDETWCLYDGELVDDELNILWNKFAENVRILVFSDSCHSGTMARAPMKSSTYERLDGNQPKVYRYMPPSVALRTYRANRKMYDNIQKKTAAEIKESLNPKARVLLISGCQDFQLSLDGTFNGKFTGTLLKVWNEGVFRGDYKQFHRSICGFMPPTQTPNLDVFGSSDIDFVMQRPFAI